MVKGFMAQHSCVHTSWIEAGHKYLGCVEFITQAVHETTQPKLGSGIGGTSLQSQNATDGNSTYYVSRTVRTHVVSTGLDQYQGTSQIDFQLKVNLLLTKHQYITGNDDPCVDECNIKVCITAANFCCPR